MPSNGRFKWWPYKNKNKGLGRGLGRFSTGAENLYLLPHLELKLRTKHERLRKNVELSDEFCWKPVNLALVPKLLAI